MSPSHYDFCTYFDRNYLARGLVLYRSLVRHCQSPFTLWVLCFDTATYEFLSGINFPEIRLIALEQFEAGDLDLQKVKTERSSVEYFWTCTPSLPLYIFRHHPEVHSITYLDADLCFFEDPSPIYTEMGDGSILIIEHRYTSEQTYHEVESGIFNVGLLVFQQDERGLACLHWWRERCLEWCYSYYEDGKYGDQLYLNDWPQRFAGVVVLQHKGAGLAPWNAAQYNFKWDEGQLTVNEFPLIFYHFHEFKFVTRNVVQPASRDYRLPSLLIEYLYFPYAYALRKAEHEIDMGKNIKIHAKNSGWLKLLPGLLEQRWLLITARRFALFFWMLGERQHDRLLTGFDAYRRKDLMTARHLCFLAIMRNPFDLLDRQILSILARTTLKPGQISFLQRCDIALRSLKGKTDGLPNHI